MQGCAAEVRARRGKQETVLEDRELTIRDFHPEGVFAKRAQENGCWSFTTLRVHRRFALLD